MNLCDLYHHYEGKNYYKDDEGDSYPHRNPDFCMILSLRHEAILNSAFRGLHYHKLHARFYL